MATEETLVEPGTVVNYHGSKKHRWAFMVVLRVITRSDGQTRYILQYGTKMDMCLTNVRRSSFTPVIGF